MSRATRARAQARRFGARRSGPAASRQIRSAGADGRPSAAVKVNDDLVVVTAPLERVAPALEWTELGERDPAHLSSPDEPRFRIARRRATYSNRLPITGDPDCADVNGPVTVRGSDPYRLDNDNEGVGCE